MINASGVEIKLSKAQQRAYDKLTDDWQDAYDLRERLNVLNALVNKGLTERSRGLASGFFPRTTKYRRKKVQT